MKTIFLFPLVVVSALLISADSCKGKKSSSGISGSSQPATSVSSSTSASAETQQDPAPKEETVRFVVSFYSIGQGIDGIMHDKFIKYMENYPKKITYEPKYWGREGEVDYCLGLKELSSDEQSAFIDMAKNILSNHVYVNENSKCQHSASAGEGKYRLVISFYSIGQGINTNKHEKFQAFLTNYSPKITYESVKWGREGEIDYCFQLSELSAVQQAEFVNKAKEILVPPVNVSENVRCPH